MGFIGERNIQVFLPRRPRLGRYPRKMIEALQRHVLCSVTSLTKKLIIIMCDTP